MSVARTGVGGKSWLIGTINCTSSPWLEFWYPETETGSVGTRLACLKVHWSDMRNVRSTSLPQKARTRGQACRLREKRKMFWPILWKTDLIYVTLSVDKLFVTDKQVSLENADLSLDEFRRSMCTRQCRPKLLFLRFGSPSWATWPTQNETTMWPTSCWKSTHRLRYPELNVTLEVWTPRRCSELYRMRTKLPAADVPCAKNMSQREIYLTFRDKNRQTSSVPCRVEQNQ